MEKGKLLTAFGHTSVAKAGELSKEDQSLCGKAVVIGLLGGI